MLQSSESFLLRYAGVGYTVHVVFEELVFLLGSEVTVVGHSFVVGVGNEIHDVLLEVVGGA